ncbi:MAG TPA: RNA polymerase factor sigma-54 [Sedimenticola sp.]|nr:RNA polymerase factor sigma-54 [Sedimenticola sp.]
MKQTLQLRLGQHLTMTPQLQQAIRLLQLSTLDLKQEIQEALESNFMLEMEEEGVARDQAREEDAAPAPADESGPAPEQGAGETPAATGSEQEINVESSTIPEELPVDSGWDDVYDSTLPPASGSASREVGDSDYLSQRRTARTLHDYLTWQLNLTAFSPDDRVVAETIVEAVNEDGYLSSSLEEIVAGLSEEVGIEEAEAVLHRIQQFDPPGVAARDPRECLLIQLRQYPEEHHRLPLAITLVEDHFDLLAQQDRVQIKRQLKIDDQQLGEVMELIRSLTPRPGTLVADAETQYVVPDVFVYRSNGAWHVDLNPEATPRLRVNPEYVGLIRRADSSDDNVYLKNHLQEARWFIKSLISRNETLLKVATKIVEFQRGFFEHGEEAMRPLVLRDIAEALEMHESTISRVTTQKYMHTPRGTFEFKYFFSSHVNTDSGGECSATAIRALIRKLISAEKPKKPLSDNKIAGILSEQGIKVARRTVAKYRESMAIPPSNERKRLV